MSTRTSARRLARGFSLIELLVSMTITLVIVIAAALIYSSVRDTDNAQSRSNDSIETGVFALQLIGRDIAQAGTYPVVMPPTTQYFPTGRWMEFYPPTGWSGELSNAAYQSGIFGCEGGRFNSITAACVTTTAMSPYRSVPDSIVINYFSTEAANTPVGNRKDCTGTDAGNDAVNATRKNNITPDVSVTPPVPTGVNANLPPYRPVFVSNRYALSTSTFNIEVDKQTVATKSLDCNGNGQSGSIVGNAATVNTYQNLLLGIEDMQITYGVSLLDGPGTTLTLAPDRFYTATQVSALSAVVFDGDTYQPWDRVTAVRVCVMTKTLGTARIQDKSGSARTYLDCTDDTPQSYAANDIYIRKRHVQVFALRGRLTQTY